MSRIQLRRDTASNWTAANPILAAGEVGIEYTSDPALTEKVKIGDGVTDWVTLPYFTSGGGGGGAPDPHAASHADGGSDEVSIDASQITTGTIADARIPAAITRDTELAAHEADTTNIHGITDTSTLYRSGGIDVAVADGGTGASTAANARTNLGLVIGTDVAANTHNHAATDINSGTIATARLGSGTANNTTFLRGDQTWATPAGGGSSGIRVEDEGISTVAAATGINFAGPLVAVTDAGSNEALVTVDDELWTPALLSTSELLGWWKPESLGAGASSISSWTDSSGNGHHLVQATGSEQPVVVTTGPNGLKAASFDGTTWLQALYTNNSPDTIFMLYKAASTADGWHLDGGSGRRALRSQPSGSMSFVYVPGNEGLVSVPLTTSRYSMICVRASDAVQTAHYNDRGMTGPNDIGDTGTTASPGGITLGSNYEGGGSGALDVCELIHLPGMVTPNLRRRVTDYLGRRSLLW